MTAMGVFVTALIGWAMAWIGPIRDSRRCCGVAHFVAHRGWRHGVRWRFARGSVVLFLLQGAAILIPWSAPVAVVYGTYLTTLLWRSFTPVCRWCHSPLCEVVYRWDDESRGIPASRAPLFESTNDLVMHLRGRRVTRTSDKETV